MLPQNIYIISDEKSKKGDWVIWFGKDNRPFLKKVIDERGGEWLLSSTYDMWVEKDKPKKIILTNDPELIKDGVQEISEEFLKQYVTNPVDYTEIGEIYNQELNACKEVCEFKQCHSFFECKYVDENDLSKTYKIIIPKEESKPIHQQIIDAVGGEDTFKKIAKIKPKQETLEEAVERIYLSHGNNEILYGHSEDSQLVYKAGVLDGVKWQQKRSYSEEEVKLMFDRYNEFISHHDIEEWQSWIDKQFKNK